MSPVSVRKDRIEATVGGQSVDRSGERPDMLGVLIAPIVPVMAVRIVPVMVVLIAPSVPVMAVLIVPVMVVTVAVVLIVGNISLTTLVENINLLVTSIATVETD